MQKWSKEVKSGNFCNHKVGRAINLYGAIEKSPVLLLHKYYLRLKIRVVCEANFQY